MARALLGLEQADLSARAGIYDGSVMIFETERRLLRPAALVALRAAFEGAGIRFVDGRLAGAILAGDAATDGVGLVCPARCRAARAGLRLTQADLAARAGLDAGTVVRFETGQGTPRGETLRALRLALEAAGAELVESGGRGVLIGPPAASDAPPSRSRR